MAKRVRASHTNAMHIYIIKIRNLLQAMGIGVSEIDLSIKRNIDP